MPTDLIDRGGGLAFAKLFETAHGQLLYYLTEREDESPAIHVIGAEVRGVRPSAFLGYHDEGRQLQAFAKIDAAMAEGTAAVFFRMADDLAPRTIQEDPTDGR